MAAHTFAPAQPDRSRDGRQWLKDDEFCDSIKAALKSTYDSASYLKTEVTGKIELHKLRGALRYFADAEGWGLSLLTDGDETKDDGAFTVTFRAQVKKTMPPPTKPRKIKRRKTEDEDAYMARVREAHPRNTGEKQAAWDARLAEVTIPAPVADASTPIAAPVE